LLIGSTFSPPTITVATLLPAGNKNYLALEREIDFRVVAKMRKFSQKWEWDKNAKNGLVIFLNDDFRLILRKSIFFGIRQTKIRCLIIWQ